MILKGLDKANQGLVNREPEVAKPKPQVAQPQTQEGRNSKVGFSNMSADFFKHRLNSVHNASVTQETVAQPASFTASPAQTDPYANRSAEQIVAEQKANYENAGSGQVTADIGDEQAGNYENAGNKQAAAEEAGRVVADIAKYDPVKALEVANQLLADDVLEDGHRDEFAQEAVRALSDDELRQVAGSQEGQALLKQLETNLLDGRVHGDEAADANRVRVALDQNGIFLGSGEGIQIGSVEPVSVAQDPNATPEQVASYIQYNQPTAQSDFTQALEAHKDDAEWLAGFYSALGTEASGRLISETANPSTYHLQGHGAADPQIAEAQTELVRHSLETLQESGKLTQDGVNALVNATPVNPYVATEIFGKSGNNELKEMFVNAAVNNGDDTWDAGALHVISTLPAADQERILNGLGDKFNSFIEGAMVGQREMISFSDFVEHGMYAESDAELIDPPLAKMTFGGVENLLDLATDQTFQHYPYSQSSPLSEDLRLKIFDAVTTGLNNDKAFENLKDNVEFKDSLAGLFINKREEIINYLTVNNDLTEDAVVNLSKFVEIAMFTPPLGDDSNLSLNRLPGELSGMVNDLIADARDNGNTNSARLAGRLLGAIDNAAERASSRIADDKAARDKFIDTVVGFAFDLIPFPGLGKLGEGGAEIVKRALGSLEGILKANTLDRIKDMTAAEAKQFLAEELKSNDELSSALQQDAFSDLFTESVDQIGVGIDANVAAELRTAFEGAYNTIDSGNEGANPRFE